MNEHLFRIAIQQHYPNTPENVIRRIILREAKRLAPQQLSAESYAPLAVACINGYVRHNHTDYDYLLTLHITRNQARDRVRPTVVSVLAKWE